MIQKKSFQSSLTPEEIKDRLRDYTLVPTPEVTNIPIGTNISYYTVDPTTKEKKFRIGGILESVDSKLRYIKLQNGGAKWSVQLGNSILYKKMNNDEYVDSIKRTIAEKFEQQIHELKTQNDYLKRKMVDYIQLKKENEMLKSKNSK